MTHRRHRTEERRKARGREAKAKSRSSFRKDAVIAVVLVLLAAGLAYLAFGNPQGATSPGSPAADFTLVDSDGRVFRLSEHRFHPVVLFFMTTSDWCQPCKVETRDHLAPLWQAYAGRIQIVSIELLPNDRSDADLNAYKATYGSPWVYARDTAGVGTLYGIQALSTIVIVDQAGSIQYRGTDPSFDVMAGVLRRLGL